MDAKQKTRITAQFIGALPHAQALGLSLTEVADGRVVMQMPYDQKLVGDPETGVVHGGAVSALMDTAGGAAVMSHGAGLVSTATIDLRIDYLRSATPGQTIVATAECHHVTRSVAFMRATAFDDDRDRPVAMATGTYMVETGE